MLLAMKPSLVCAVALLSLAACEVESSGALDEAVELDHQPIVNGQFDTGHPGSVALTVDGQAFCTGTLVTPTVVVTAAHCISPDIGSPPWQFVEVFFGSDVSAGGVFIPLEDGLGHPNWDSSLQAPENDIAVLRLQEAAPVAPVPMADLPASGTVLTLVGFGITQANGGGGGVKRVAQATIAERFGSVFSMEVAPSGTCNGDSGGTALWNDGGVEKFVGIHTRSDCQTIMLDEVVQSHVASFVQPFIDAGVSCNAGDGCASGCASPDPDCPCAADGFCTSACVDVASDPDCDPLCAAEGTCVEDCPVPDTDCPVCIADGDCNAACESDPDCSTGEGGAGGGGKGAGGESGESDSAESDDGCDCALDRKAGGSPLSLLFGFVALAVQRRRRHRALARKGAAS